MWLVIEFNSLYRRLVTTLVIPKLVTVRTSLYSFLLLVFIRIIFYIQWLKLSIDVCVSYREPYLFSNYFSSVSVRVVAALPLLCYCVIMLCICDMQPPIHSLFILFITMVLEWPWSQRSLSWCQQKVAGCIGTLSFFLNLKWPNKAHDKGFYFWQRSKTYMEYRLVRWVIVNILQFIFSETRGLHKILLRTRLLVL